MTPPADSRAIEAHVLATCRALFVKQKALADAAVAQCSDAELHAMPAEGANSIAITMKHIAGNLRSRWTDFLTTDGEKPWRNRDSEFVDNNADDADRATLLSRWDAGWAVLFQTLDGLVNADLMQTVAIRGEPHTVIEALLRQVSHYGYHVGQIVSGARALLGSRWKTLSVPRGGSAAYNREMFATSAAPVRDARPLSGAEPSAPPSTSER